MTNLPTFEAGLPANVDAERTILGAVMMDNAEWDKVYAGLRADDFSLDSHRKIALAMKHLRDADSAVDIITLSEKLAHWKEVGEKASHLESIGGVAYIASLTEGLPFRPVIDEYIRIVKEKAMLRQLMTMCSTSIAIAAEQETSALEIMGRLQAGADKIAAVGGRKGSNVESFIAEAMEEHQREYREKITPAIPSGNPWFDHKVGGYRHGKITLVCARPNVGKTPWFLMSAAHNLKLGRKVVFFSLEQDKGEVLRNLIPYFVDLPNYIVNHANLWTPEQHALVLRGYSALAEMPLHIYDPEEGDMTIDEICYAIDRETRHGEEVLFGVDHFGLIAGQGKDTRARYNENSARLRKKIKHKKSALVALCQLRKVSREFANKAPVTDDIKESGNMYEDAYTALIIHRAIDGETKRMSRDAELNICKVRNGGTQGSTTGRFNTRSLSFEADPEIDDEQGDYYQ